MHDRVAELLGEPELPSGIGGDVRRERADGDGNSLILPSVAIRPI